MRITITSLLFVASTTSAFVAHNKNHIQLNKIITTTNSNSKIQLSLDDISSTVKGSLEETTTSIKSAIANLDNFNSLIDSKYEDSLKSLLSEIQAIFTQEKALQAEFSTIASKLSQEIDQWLLVQNPTVESLYRQILSQISSLTFDSPEALAISAFVTYTVVSSALTWGQPPPPSKPYPLQRYDPIAAQVFFDGKPLQALARGLEISLKSLGFAVSLLKDKVE